MRFSFTLGLLSAFLLVCGVSVGQLSIVNGDFEGYATLPTTTGQYFLAGGWGNAGSAIGNPDYYHVDGSGGGDLPETPVAMVTPFSGQGVMGFMATGAEGLNVREYLVGVFTEPLEQGKKYEMSFAMTNGDLTPVSIGGLAVSHLGFSFGTNSVMQEGMEVLQLSPNFVLHQPFYDRNWEVIRFVFTAQDAWSNFVMGVFKPDGAVEFEWGEGENPTIAYYFVDDFSIEEVADEIFEANNGGKRPQDTGPEKPGEVLWVPTSFTPNGDGTNDVFKPILGELDVLHFEIFNRWGECVYRVDPSLDTSWGWDGGVETGTVAESGTYVWRMRLGMEDGSEKEENGTVHLLR